MLKAMWQQIKRIYQTKQGTLYSSTVVVALTLLLARLLGLIKLRILTGYYDKEQLDLFFAAFRLPDFIFEIFVAGSIASCFIPIISGMVDEDKEKDNRAEVLAFSQSLSIIFLVLWGLIFLVMNFTAGRMIEFLVPGYTPDQVAIVTHMSLLILFYQVPFLLLGNIISSMLQAEKQFFIPGLAPAFYNIGIIAGVILWARPYGLYGALYGVVVGSVLFFLSLLLGVVILGYPIRIKINFYDNKIREFFHLFWPRFFNSLTAQVDATVDLALSTLRGVGSYSSFYLARNLQILPVSFFGIAISQTALPFFSRMYAQGKKEDMLNLFTKLILQITFIMMPFVIFFTALRIPIVRLFFGGDKFGWEATVRTANVLSIFAISLPFHTVYYVITRAFFAIQDTRTPFITGVIFTMFNTLLSVLFIRYLNLPVWFLALSFTISITLNSLILFYILIRRLDSIRLLFMASRVAVIGMITVITTLGVWLLKRLLDGLVFDTTRTINLLSLTAVCVLFGSSLYVYLAWVLIPEQLKQVLGLFTRLSFLKKTISKYRKTPPFAPASADLPVEDKLDEKI